ncbi:GAF domain-containing protein [Geodermatophilus normandii]|uniref:GAF domain-containing protein n=1 Tax=Geodermatophilus normandii TaxID=1137989 RepID=A0A317QGH6_9ACTN|nr:GAF and ANTAR domain-containing protein [Geodermatophilus normandii]PWW22169.1 GAF domain-containing protein [Geodermatophilus normandii]
MGDVGDRSGGSAPIDRPDELMSRIARRLQVEHGDVEGLLQAITTAAVTTVPGAETGSISYVHARRQVQSRAATGDLSRRVDEAQERLHEGPCLDAVWEQQVVRVEDMRHEPRWPRFAAEAAALGVGSSLSFRLMVEDDRLGALNLYSHGPGAFTDASVEIGLAIAAHAAIALTGARTEANLRAAIDSRDLIGQAKGILMERYKITAAQAFAVLARASQETNRKLLDIALTLNDTGAMPAPRTPEDPPRPTSRQSAGRDPLSR